MRRTRIGAIALSAGLLVASCGSDSGGDSAATTAAGSSESGAAPSGGDPKACAEGKTMDAGKLTIATGEPAFPPYVIDDTPETGQGFEAAIALTVAEQMGFGTGSVEWVRTTFDEAVQPGPKSFDFNLQQYSITPERAQIVKLSDPYYTSSQAILGFADSPAASAKSAADLKDLKLGAAAGTTSLDFISEQLQPSSDAFVFNDNAAAKQALESKQIDAVVTDLPTALYITGVEIEATKVFGQFPTIEGQGDQLGMLFSKDNPLVECVNLALASLKQSGDLDAITTKWMSDYTEAPVIPLG